MMNIVGNEDTLSLWIGGNTFQYFRACIEEKGLFYRWVILTQLSTDDVSNASNDGWKTAKYGPWRQCSLKTITEEAQEAIHAIYVAYDEPDVKRVGGFVKLKPL